MKDELKTLVADTLGLEPGRVDMSLNRDDEEAWDSLNHLRLVTAIEQSFGIQFSMQEIQSANSVADLVNVLQQHGIEQ